MRSSRCSPARSGAGMKFRRYRIRIMHKNLLHFFQAATEIWAPPPCEGHLKVSANLWHCLQMQTRESQKNAVKYFTTIQFPLRWLDIAWRTATKRGSNSHARACLQKTSNNPSAIFFIRSARSIIAAAAIALLILIAGADDDYDCEWPACACCFFGLVFLCSCASASCELRIASWHLDIANAQVMGLGT